MLLISTMDTSRKYLFIQKCSPCNLILSSSIPWHDFTEKLVVHSRVADFFSSQICCSDEQWPLACCTYLQRDMKHIRIHVDVAQVVFHVSFVVGVKFQYSRTAPINFHSVTLTNYERKKKPFTGKARRQVAVFQIKIHHCIHVVRQIDKTSRKGHKRKKKKDFTDEVIHREHGL